MKKLWIIFSLTIFLLVGCREEPRIAVYSQNEQEKIALENTLKDVKEIFEGTAIFVEDELLVAIQVNPWIGFKERKIEKKVQKQLKDQYPNAHVLVSTDYKLYFESNQLMKDENKENLTKDIKKLKDLAKEET